MKSISHEQKVKHGFLILLGWLALLINFAGCQGSKQPPEEAPTPRFIQQVPWAGKGHWLKADMHIHTRFSDGSHTVEEVVEKAVEFGCGVIAITDHGDHDRKAATAESHEAIEAARRKFPQILILEGLEWNIPPWGGDEHATILIPPGGDDWQTLAAFKQQFDDYGKKEHRAELANEGLRWLETKATRGDLKPIVLLNHPSRKAAHSLDHGQDLLRWRSVNDLVIGFAGAPGHQGNRKSLGSYKNTVKPVDRWDPAAATVGDLWDTLLGQGMDLWAADAPSDFHNADPGDLNDFWPGQFSETWLYVPEVSVRGVFQAYRAGTFFGVHGHIVRQVEFTVEADGLPRPAHAGEVVELPKSSVIRVKVQCQVPETDWQGQPNRIDDVELIGIQNGAAKVFATKPLSENGVAVFDPITVPANGLVLRVRGRRIIPDGPDLMFYSNPIRVRSNP